MQRQAIYEAIRLLDEYDIQSFELMEEYDQRHTAIYDELLYGLRDIGFLGSVADVQNVRIAMWKAEHSDNWAQYGKGGHTGQKGIGFDWFIDEGDEG